MNTEEIITLENNEEYLILDIIMDDEKKYLFTSEFKDETINPENAKFFLEEEEDGEIYVSEVTNKDKLKELCVIQATQIKYIDDPDFKEMVDKELDNLKEDSI